ncbi:MAG: hypothetical protein PHQ33_06720, partial [Bacteroidales bacterium]|nr:hypothetical protein [Bacteroidales bacterium]
RFVIVGNGVGVYFMLSLFAQLLFVKGDIGIFGFACFGKHINNKSCKCLFLRVAVLVCQLTGRNFLH